MFFRTGKKKIHLEKLFLNIEKKSPPLKTAFGAGEKKATSKNDFSGWKSFFRLLFCRSKTFILSCQSFSGKE